MNQFLALALVVGLVACSGSKSCFTPRTSTSVNVEQSQMDTVLIVHDTVVSKDSTPSDSQ